MLLYNPNQKAYHIEELEYNNPKPLHGYRVVQKFFRYDSALAYYKMLIKKETVL